jgi:hypothetical protein
MAALGGSSAVELDAMYLQPSHVHRHSDVSDLRVVNAQQPSPGIEDQAEGRGSDHDSEIIPVGTPTETSLRYAFLLGSMCTSISGLHHECLTYDLIDVSYEVYTSSFVPPCYS